MSQKRDLLLATALDLFYRYGINSIGINEVIFESKVAKRTLYTHFKSKDELVLAALNKRHLVFINWLETTLAPAQSDSELIDRLFNALASWFNNTEAELGNFRGCFFINTTAEFSDPNSDVAKCCKQHKLAVRDVIKKHLISNSPELLDAICLLKEGAITTAFVTGDSTLAINTSKAILAELAAHTK